MSRTRKTTDLSVAHYETVELETFRNDHSIVTGPLPKADSVLRSMRVDAHYSGYTFYPRAGRFVSFKKDLLVPKSYRHGEQTFLDGVLDERIDGVWATAEIDRVGPITFVSLSNAFAPLSDLEELLGERPEDHVLLYSYHDEADGKIHVRSHSGDNRVKNTQGSDNVAEFSIKLLPEEK